MNRKIIIIAIISIIALGVFLIVILTSAKGIPDTGVKEEQNRSEEVKEEEVKEVRQFYYDHRDGCPIGICGDGFSEKSAPYTLRFIGTRVDDNNRWTGNIFEFPNGSTTVLDANSNFTHGGFSRGCGQFINDNGSKLYKRCPPRTL